MQLSQRHGLYEYNVAMKRKIDEEEFESERVRKNTPIPKGSRLVWSPELNRMIWERPNKDGENENARPK